MHTAGLKVTTLDTPLLWVDLDALEGNIRSLASYFAARGVGWRPHVKGIKVPAIAHQALAAGAIGVTCAKVGEAEAMAAAGIQDILIANQVVGPHKIARLVDLRRRADVKVAVDGGANVAELGQAARENGVELGIVVEVDVGMKRAGVAPGQPTVDLSRIVHETPGLRYRGLMAWEGHTRGEMDRHKRRALIEESVALLIQSADRCVEAGLPVSIVSAGGTGTYYVTAGLKGITEIQAGGAIFCDVLGQAWDAVQDGAAATEPCLFVRAMVTSRPSPYRIIFDAGFKTLPAGKQAPVPLGLSCIERVLPTAEHLKVELALPDTTVQVGDVLDFVVGYGDSTVFLHDRLYGLRDGSIEAVWAIGGREQSR